MLKHLLRNIHPILIYEEIDHPKRTVSLELALTRLETLGVSIEEKERRVIRKAAEYRNRVVHYEVELNKFEWKNVYAQFFEFVHFFHQKHLKAELHLNVKKENWPVEARLIRYFRENFVIYNGVEMHKDNPKDITDAQRIESFAKGTKIYKRFRYGEEPGWLSFSPDFAEIPCHDCGVLKGQFHADGCDMEECPRCHSQLLGCGCW
jgi:hypothetical protein